MEGKEYGYPAGTRVKLLPVPCIRPSEFTGEVCVTIDEVDYIDMSTGEWIDFDGCEGYLMQRTDILCKVPGGVEAEIWWPVVFMQPIYDDDDNAKTTDKEKEKEL